VRILVVNVNTTEAMTQDIAARARRFAGAGTEIVGLTPFFGAESCSSNRDSYLAAVGVLDRVLAYDGDYDAVVQAGFGEHGREALQEVLDVPVVDITDAAVHLACLLGRRYSVLTTMPRAIPLIEDRLLLAGVLQHCASVRATGLGVLELSEDPEQTLDVLTLHAIQAIENDGADVLCLGCAGMGDYAEQLHAAVGAPIVDGVAAAVKMAETLHSLGLSTSKVGTFAPPEEKKTPGWPISSGENAKARSAAEAVGRPT
jgi:allantoin racemase